MILFKKNIFLTSKCKHRIINIYQILSMGNNIGRNAGLEAVSKMAQEFKPLIEKLNTNINFGLNEISNFTKSLEKHADTLTVAFKEIDKKINAILTTLIIVLIILIIYGFAKMANKFIMRNPTSNYSIVTFVSSLKNFSLVTIIFLTMVAAYLREEIYFQEVLQFTILFGFLTLFVLLVVIINWILTNMKNSRDV